MVREDLRRRRGAEPASPEGAPWLRRALICLGAASLAFLAFQLLAAGFEVGPFFFG